MIRITIFIVFALLSSHAAYARDNDSAQERARQMLEAKKKREQKEKLEKERLENEIREKFAKEEKDKAGQVYQGPSANQSEKKSADSGVKKDRAVEKVGYGLSTASACRKLASKDERRSCLQEKNRKKHRKIQPSEKTESKDFKEFKENREKDKEKSEKPTTASE